MQLKEANVLGLVITDGVGYRNFVLSNFFQEACGVFERVVIYSGLPEAVYDLQGNQQVEVRELPVFTEPSRTWFWRKFKEMAHLQLHRDFFGINDNLQTNKSSSETTRGKASRFMYKVTTFFKSEKFIQFLERKQQKTLIHHQATKTCSKFLEIDNPDLLFFTHQRPPFVMPIYVAAEKRRVKTSTFIFSWDNLSSKGRMAAAFNNYLVWSDLMKQELLYFYPSVAEKEVAIVGTPQFEPYVMPVYHEDKSWFYERFDLDPRKKTICYSCGDISTSKNDELYIETLASFIFDKKIAEPVNFLVRTSPAEEPDRFRDLMRKFPSIRWNFPDWKVSRQDHSEIWSQRVPATQDLVDLRAVLTYSDLNVNMCSTMSLDFMIFDKPVINPVFGNEENGLYNDQRFLKFGHYEKVVASGAVKIAKNEEELLQAVNFYLLTPETDGKNRSELMEMQIGKPIKGTSKRIVSLLKKMSSGAEK